MDGFDEIRSHINVRGDLEVEISTFEAFGGSAAEGIS